MNNNVGLKYDLLLKKQGMYVDKRMVHNVQKAKPAYL
jgi:hypothetical protein